MLAEPAAAAVAILTLGTTTKGQTAKDLVRNAKHSRLSGRM
jgi:hypothetical protein